MASSRPAKQSQKKDKYERYKIASIPILLLVLVYVLLAPDEKPPVPTVATAAMTIPTSNLASLPASRPAETIPATGDKRTWPDLSLEFAAAGKSQPNPFARMGIAKPHSADQPLVDCDTEVVSSEPENLLSEVARELARQPVKYVFKSAGSKFVMLGEQVYKEGQSLAPSVQLHGIDDDALIIGPHRVPPLVNASKTED